MAPASHIAGGDAPAPSETRAEAIPRFVNVTTAVGLDGVRGDSFVWGDWNNDGLPDLLVKGSRLFKNIGGRFSEVTGSVGLNNSGYSVLVDLNGDSFLDIFSVGHPYNFQDTVWFNTGPPDFGFRNVSDVAMIEDGMPGLACAAGDIDHDGDLDIYVVNWRDDANVKYPDILWRNDGGGHFTDITERAGIVDWNVDRGEPNAGMGVNMGDYNDDGWIDIYVSNYLICPNYLWENQHDGTFKDVALEKGCAGEPLKTPTDTYYGHTAGSQWADYDNDRDLDLWCSNLAHKDPYRTLLCDNSELWRNDGADSDYSFTNVRDQTGIPINHLGNEELFFGIAWGDFDNDGYQDMFIPQVKNYIDYAFSYLFLANGDGTFTDVSDQAGFRTWDCVGGAWCDYDLDGDLDLIADGKYPYENGTYAARLYQNQGTNGNGIIEIDLENVGDGPIVGARIELYGPDGVYLGMREVEGGTAGHSFGPSTTAEFGLGTRQGPFSVIVRWPDGRMQYKEGIDRGSKLRIQGPTASDLSIGGDVRDAVLEGDGLRLDLVCENTGGSDVKDVSIRVIDSPSGRWDRDIPIGALPSGQTWSDGIDLGTSGAAGEHSLRVTIMGTFPVDDMTSNNAWEGTVLVKARNSRPTIESFDAQTRSVVPGGWINLTVLANDPDGDVLTYSFSSDIGTFVHDSGRAPVAYWLAPSGPEVKDGADVSLNVEVSDGKGGKDTDRLMVHVEKRLLPPVISEVRISTAVLENDGRSSYRLEVVVSDDTGLPGIWKVEADLSDLGGDQDTPMVDTGSGGDLVAGDGTYTLLFVVQPDAKPGNAVIKVTAYDLETLSSSQELPVTVDGVGSKDNVDSIKPIAIGFAMIAILIFAFPLVYIVSKRMRN
jgi:hypothetical protein